MIKWDARLYLELLDITHLIVHLNLECIDLEELCSPLRLVFAIHGSLSRGVQVADELVGRDC